MPDSLLLFILEKANKKVQNFCDRFADNADYSYKNKHCKLLDMVELKVFFGLLYLRALLKSNISLVVTMCYYESSNDIFAATMSIKRFHFISRFTEFDVKEIREERWKYDKFPCMRYIFDEVNCKFAKGQNPSPFLAIEETLYSYQGHISFKQHNSSKPAKYGLLYCSLCDASVPCTCYSLPYAGKPDVIDDEANKYYVTRTGNYAKYLVNGFCKFNKIKGCNISMDRYFTSVSLAKWVSENNFTIVGIMRFDCIGLPNEKSIKYLYQKDGNALLVSYIDKKNSGKKKIVVLSTMHSIVRVTKDEQKKPHVHSFYNHTKGVVDIVDLISSHQSTRFKSPRWPVNALAFLLDTI